MLLKEKGGYRWSSPQWCCYLYCLRIFNPAVTKKRLTESCISETVSNNSKCITSPAEVIVQTTENASRSSPELRLHSSSQSRRGNIVITFHSSTRPSYQCTINLHDFHISNSAGTLTLDRFLQSLHLARDCVLCLPVIVGHSVVVKRARYISSPRAVYNAAKSAFSYLLILLSLKYLSVSFY